MELNIREMTENKKKIKLELLESLMALNKQIIDNNTKKRVIDPLEDANDNQIPDVVDKIDTEIVALTPGVDDDKIAVLNAEKGKVDNYLTRWTRMDLFPGPTRENIYPRTAMERTQRRDFLGKGVGKVFPFGLKQDTQMSGVGGSSSDVIKLRRLYGRANYWKNRKTSVATLWNY